MEFANLSGLLWGLLAVPIVVFYILKIRLRRAPVSTVMFWAQVFEEKRPRSLWRQLRHLVSLLLQLALLALLVAALLDPSFSWEKLRARRLVLVVDNSASMNATDVSPSRLAEAKRQGRRLIRGLRLRDQVAIISAGSVARVRCGLTGHQRTLRTALDAIEPTDGPTSVPAAVALARRLLADHANGKVIVLSDGCFADARRLSGARDVDLVAVGNRTGNVAISQFQVRRSLLDPVGYQILVEVANLSEEPAECRLEIDLNGDAVDVVPLKLDPEGRWSKAIDQTAAEGGRLVARLDREDALAADNQAVALLPARPRQAVLLVTEGSLFLQRVFEAIPIVNLTLTDTPPSRFPPKAIVVFHRKVPKTMPPGNVMVIDPLQSTDLWELGEPAGHPIVADQDTDSPLMTHVRLDNVVMPEARKLRFATEHQVLAPSIEGDPLYTAIESGRAKLLVLTVNLAKGDLPLRTAFPIMMTNAISWFQGSQGELREAAATGSVMDVELSPLLSPDAAAGSSGAPAPPLTVRSPGGAVRPLPAGVTVATIGPLDQCGIWSIEPEGDGEGPRPDENRPKNLQFACNLASARESDLRPEADLAGRTPASFSAAGGRPIWFYLIAAALALTTAEWYLYQRRWIS